MTNEIEKLRQELHAEIDRRCDGIKKETKHKYGWNYWLINSKGHVCPSVWHNRIIDRDRSAFYNAFSTKENAELAKKYITKSRGSVVTGDCGHLDLWEDFRNMMKKEFGV